MSAANPFQSAAQLPTAAGEVTIHRLDALAKQGVKLERLPVSIRILLENALRNFGKPGFTAETVEAIAGWKANDPNPPEIPLLPARVILQDFTGVPCVVDLAAMRDAMAALGGDPKKINPVIPVDLVIDHSVQVDEFGSAEALGLNVALEFSRNRERYEFLKWGQQAFRNLRIVPPSSGIVHQVNLERLACGVFTADADGKKTAYPDSLVGTDSHTTMINGLGVLGWGVGGIEAEACMLGQPISMLLPEVVGFKLTGQLPAGTTATDLVLTVTEMLRKQGVVGKFVEFFGPGLSKISLADRATIANMAPEYGATMGFFPVDDETLRYLRQTGRPADLVDLNEKYWKAQGLFRTDATPDPEFTATLTLDMATVVPSLAGPKRPQDRVPLTDMRAAFKDALSAPTDKRGFALPAEALGKTAAVLFPYPEAGGGPGRSAGNGTAASASAPHPNPPPEAGGGSSIGHGALVIAAITSCTNTSNPSVMVGAGLLARNAVAKGLKVPGWVKTSLAPGSRVVTSYLDQAGLSEPLSALGFQTVGYGCTTCIGNSGPLPAPVDKAIAEGNLVVASVLSGNRNFEGRVHPSVKANYLASPPLVVAYALAGTVDIDLHSAPLGTGKDGQPVYLKDVWPSDAEIQSAIAACVGPAIFEQQYGKLFDGDAAWQKVKTVPGERYRWDDASTYIQNPPFFQGLARELGKPKDIVEARVLAKLGDSVTTDHISPAGNIKADSAAGQFLEAAGVPRAEFNSYGSRRGNDRVMTRGTFANIRLRNLLVPGSEGPVTIHYPSGERMSIYDAAMRYQSFRTPTIVLAGAEYGTGSSRDWAAKGTMLLGVKAVLAKSFERIHRSNLVGMGVLPLQFRAGETHETLGLKGDEAFSIGGIAGGPQPRSEVAVTATSPAGTKKTFHAVCRIDTPVEVDYFRHGGILQAVLRGFLEG